MSDHSVDTAEVRRLAARVQPLAGALRAVATQLGDLSSAAGSTGSGACAAAFTTFCQQWAEELREEAEAYDNIAGAMVSASALYEATEVANLVGEIF